MASFLSNSNAFKQKPNDTPKFLRVIIYQESEGKTHTELFCKWI